MFQCLTKLQNKKPKRKNKNITYFIPPSGGIEPPTIAFTMTRLCSCDMRYNNIRIEIILRIISIKWPRAWKPTLSVTVEMTERYCHGSVHCVSIIFMILTLSVFASSLWHSGWRNLAPCMMILGSNTLTFPL